MSLNNSGIGATAVMILWATCYPLISLSLPHAPIMVTAFLRAAVAGSVVVALALLLKRPMPRSLVHWAYILAVGLTATSVGFWGMFYAGSLISPGLATVLTNTQPIVASALGWYFLQEHLSRTALAGVLLGFAGIVIVSSDGLLLNGQAPNGVGYVLVATTGIAFSNILLKRLANKVDVLFTMGFQLLIGSIPLGLLWVFQEPLNSFSWSWNYFWILVGLAIPGTAAPFILWFWLMEKKPLYQLNVYSFLTPVFGLYFGYAYFSESITYSQWIGILVVTIAIAIVGAAARKTDG